MSDTASHGPASQLRHDLRTPINHILGYSELLEEDLTDRGVTDISDLRKIRHAARTLLDLIQTRLGNDSALSGASPKLDRPAEAEPLAESDAEPELEEAKADQPAVPGRILVVDDSTENRETLVRRLRRDGHLTAEARHGGEALEMLAEKPFDLVLLDVMMPEVDGTTTLTRMKADEALRHVPVIMISALDEIESVVRCIERGAEDYLPKPFNPVLLRARIGASLQKKRFRDQEQSYLHRIEETQKRLHDELQEAGRYVASILPPPESDPFPIAWSYHPSTELGGDSFGYHWIDEDHFAIYLLDVCGHGVGASLLSVAAINVIRSGAMIGTDLRMPSQVLKSLNSAFQMERHNNMYFTIWYGVYAKSTRTLRHASGGHPPAILLTESDAGVPECRLLRCPGMIVGVVESMTYADEETVIPPGSRLFLYSDGAYEVHRPDDSMMDFDSEFVPFFLTHGRRVDFPSLLLEWVRNEHGQETLDDDFSVVAVDFPLEG